MESQLPENHNKPWDYGSEKVLEDMIVRGVSRDECAEHFKRTPGGIRSRVMVIAKRVFSEGTLTTQQVAMRFHIDTEDLERSLQATKNATDRKKLLRKVEEKEETLLEVCKEIRDLLKMLVINK